MDELPRLDTDPEEWGPDHIELEAVGLDQNELDAEIAEGNRQGRDIDPDDDEDNGLEGTGRA